MVSTLSLVSEIGCSPLFNFRAVFNSAGASKLGSMWERPYLSCGFSRRRTLIDLLCSLSILSLIFLIHAEHSEQHSNSR